MSDKLVVKGMTAGYGDADIIQSIDLLVKEGQIVTIAGTNGAGKSSLVRAIMGLLPRVRGEAIVDGFDVLTEPTERRLVRGVGYVPQVKNIFPSLSVLENLQVVEHVRNWNERVAFMFELFPVLQQKANVAAGHLSGGERQQLAFARALMPSPSLLLLDEPSAALSPALVEQVFSRVRSLAQLGVSVLMVEQRARQALSFSDYGYILDGGQVVLRGEASTLLQNDEMANLYLGHKES
jgi:branched-chain amino acid transport system ATP-binding protein